MKRESLLRDIVRAAGMMAIAIVLVMVPRIARAHAALMGSNPAANSTVHGPDVPITLKFNSRVDGARSTLALVGASGPTLALAVEKQTAPNTLSAHASRLEPGKYSIRWQALATDGHITRGEVPFTVE